MDIVPVKSKIKVLLNWVSFLCFTLKKKKDDFIKFERSLYLKRRKYAVIFVIKYLWLKEADWQEIFDQT